MVATVHELASSATAVGYYEKDGYYAKNDPEHRKASFWHGEAARDLGLRGHVVPSRFESVLSGQVPKSDIRLGRIVEGEHQHRPGWDITFSAPKSVSLEALVMGDSRVIRAHDEAVRATLDWIESDLLQTRSWDPRTKRRPRVKADGMVVAGFRHLTSRDLDPQLHTHCVLANMTRNDDGAWRSIEPTALRRSEKLIGAHYRNELASRLVALGLAVTPKMVGPVPGFELAGYDAELLDAFSGRRREILAYLEKHGLPMTKEATQKATLHTRRRKVEAGLDELVPQWRKRAQALGLTRDETALKPPRPVDPATGRETPLPRHEGPVLSKNERRRLRRAPALPRLDPVEEATAPERQQRPAAPVELVAEPETGVLEAVARAVAHFEERRTVIPVSEIRTLVLGHAPGRYRLGDIDRAIERLVTDGELREATLRGSDRSFVTDRAIKAERRILGIVKEGQKTVGALSPDEKATARLAATTLTTGQANAVRHILGAGDTVVGVQGRAGSGKTTMLKEVAGLVGWRSLVGLAPSAAAARVLEKEAGIPTRTLQWFLVRYGDLSDPVRLRQAREDLAGSMLAVDEASMIGTVAMERLLTIARATGISRVALVGDTAQLRAVNAGQPFALMQKAGMATAVMDEVLRQKDPDLKEAVARAREGEAREAMTRLANRVTEHRVEDLGHEAARAWLALAPHERDSCAVLAPTHAIRREINETIREGLADEGVLSGKTLRIERLVNRRYTRVEASVIANYEPGDTVVFHRDAYGCQTDDVCTIREVRDGWIVLDHADGRERRFRPSGNAAHNLGVYESVTIEIRAGDRVRWTRNRKARRYTPALVNGEEARVLSIGSQRVRLMTNDGTEYSLSRNDPHLRHLDHAYSSTVHGAQGRTAARVIAVLNAGRMANQEMFYVEVSRASEGFTLLTDDREALIERLETSPDVPDAALEAIGEDLDGPVVDPDEWAALVADWEAVGNEAEGSGARPSSVPAYAGVMARIAAFAAIEDLPDDMRAFVDRRLENHERHRAAERGVRAIIAGLQAHWRRWPELAWAARPHGCPTDEHPAWQTWRDEGTALIDTTRRLLDEALDGDRSPGILVEHREGLETALAHLEDVRLREDAARFARDWHAFLDRAEKEAVPVSHLPGYEVIAHRGGILSRSARLAADERHAADEWQARHTLEASLIEDITSLPDVADMLVEWRKEQVPIDGAGRIDPEDPGIVEWRHDAVDHLRHSTSILEPDAPHAAHFDAMPDARLNAEAATRELAENLRQLDRATLLWRARKIEGRARAAGLLPSDVPEWLDTLGAIRSAADTGSSGDLATLDDPTVGHLIRWLDEDERWHRDRQHLDALVSRLKRLERERPRYAEGRAPAEGPDRQVWRKVAEALREDLVAVRTMPDHEWSAHLLACDMEPAAFDDLAGSVPLWIATDEALTRVADWHRRAAEVRPDDAGRAGALIEEGRSLPGSWRAASIPAADMEGAGDDIEATVFGLEAALLMNECEAFSRLCQFVNRDMKASGVHFLDTADYPRLLDAMRSLEKREGVPDDTRALVAQWQEADRRWNDERQEAAAIVERARALADAGRTHAAGRASPDDPGTVAWRADASGLLRTAGAMLAADALHARHLNAVPGARANLEAAIATITVTLQVSDRATLLRQVREIESRADAAGQLSLDMPEWSGTLEALRAAVVNETPENATVQELARRLEEDGRWRRDRDEARAVIDRLEKFRQRQPRYSGNAERAMAEGSSRKAWLREAAGIAQAFETVTGSLTDRERTAHLRVCGTTPDQVQLFVDAIPAWQDADTALDRLADWHGRVSQVLRDGPEGGLVKPGDAGRVGALIEDGKRLSLITASLFLGDTSGAGKDIGNATERLEAALLKDGCETFARLARSVDGDAKVKGVHPLDAADYSRLFDALRNLERREGVQDDTRARMAQWQEADRRWNDERKRVDLLMGHARRLERERTLHVTESGGSPRPMSDSWRRNAEALSSDARSLAQPVSDRERDAHIRALGGDPGAIGRILAAVPGWLEADDAVRREAGRSDHLRKVRDATRQVLEYPASGVRTVPWNGTEPLVRGDRLTWFDGRQHDMIVNRVGSIERSGMIGYLSLRPVAAMIAGTEDIRILTDIDIATLARDPSCRRVAWPDESVRSQEIERQSPVTDTTFSLPCNGLVVVGDRIRWTMVLPNEKFRDRLEDDTPQIEAVVESFSPSPVFGADKLVTLRVIRSWGMGNLPEPDERIDQRMSSLFQRGCVREPWEDEEIRARQEAEAEKEARRWGRSRGLSM